MGIKPSKKKVEIVSCKVDGCECLAHMLCLDEAPTLMQINEDGLYPSFKKVSLKTLNSNIAEIQGAIDICPVDAIKVEFSNGEVFQSSSLNIEEYLNEKQNS